jgi:CRISPR-associated exonuclease Cas4
MFDEDDLLPLSGLQHLLYCERRAALVHVEQAWSESVATVEGRQLHDRAHDGSTESRGYVRIARGLRLRSLRLGLSGEADVVEFHRVSEPPGALLVGVESLWRPFPVEYKRGRLREEEAYQVQLCAQALCLEEMLSVPVNEGALFFAATGRRMEVAFEPALREKTEEAARRLRTVLLSGRTPVASFGPKCEACSMLSACMPRTTDGRRSARRYIAAALVEPSE